MPVQRQLTAAHPWPPIKLSVGNNHSVLTRRTHRGDVLSSVGIRINSHGSTGSSEKDTVNASCCSRACSAIRQFGQYLWSFIGILRTSSSRACGIKPILPQYQLKISTFFVPQKFPILCACNNKLAPLRPGKENMVISTFNIRCG